MGITLSHGTRVPQIVIDKGMRLAAARQDAGVTQERMGELLGCSRRTITRYESDDSAPASVVIAYSMATDVNLAWLDTGVADFSDGGDFSPGGPGLRYTPRDLNPEPTDYGSAVGNLTILFPESVEESASAA